MLPSLSYFITAVGLIVQPWRGRVWQPGVVDVDILSLDVGLSDQMGGMNIDLYVCAGAKEDGLTHHLIAGSA